MTDRDKKPSADGNAQGAAAADPAAHEADPGQEISKQGRYTTENISETISVMIDLYDQLTKFPEATKNQHKALLQAMAADEGSAAFYYDALVKLVQTLERIEGLYHETNVLEPYLLEELKKPEYNGATIEDLLNEVDANGEILPGSLLEKALAAAREKAGADPEIITPVRNETFDYPLDKPNSRFWDGLQEAVDNQITMQFDMETKADRRKGLSLPAYFAVDFEAIGEDIGIAKKITPFDKRVYIAAGALFNAGNETITLTQICYAMGNTGRPAAHMLEKIDKSITKMSLTRLWADNSKEAEKYNYPVFSWDSTLLPMERKRVKIDGKVINAAIHLYREPPLITFARDRKQLTTFNAKMLQTPLRKTDGNLIIEDYLLERIGKERRAKQKAKQQRRGFTILLDRLYERAGIKDRKQRQRAPGKINELLTYYKSCGGKIGITDYEIKADRIEIVL